MFREKPIERQLERFFEFKCKRSRYQAENQREWILKFIEVTGVHDVLDITEEDYDTFYVWVYENYNGRHFTEQALHALRSLMHYFRVYKYICK